jgi:hypothetical protein
MIIFPSPFGSLPLLSRDFAGAAVERQIGDVEEVSHYRILYYASWNLQYSSAADGLGFSRWSSRRGCDKFASTLRGGVGSHATALTRTATGGAVPETGAAISLPCALRHRPE